jgi:hypothetical protein
MQYVWPALSRRRRGFETPWDYQQIISFPGISWKTATLFGQSGDPLGTRRADHNYLHEYFKPEKRWGKKRTCYFSVSFVTDRGLGREFENHSLGERYAAASALCPADHPVRLAVEKKNVPFSLPKSPRCQRKIETMNEADVYRKYVVPGLIASGWDNAPHFFTNSERSTGAESFRRSYSESEVPRRKLVNV